MSRSVSMAALPLALVFAGLVLSGCKGGIAGGLRAAGARSAPDEFAVLPTKPLEMPQDLAQLPEPTPGAANRVEYDPTRIAVGGLSNGPTPPKSADGTALVARAGVRTAPDIRDDLAAEDVEYRKTNQGKLLERWFIRDQDSLIYKDQALDANAEYERLRNSELNLPAPPPSLTDPQ